MDSMISFSHVSFSYGEAPDAALVLDNVSLDFRAGEFTAVLGHNGSGKSTLAKHCNGILLPTSGTVTVAGMSTAQEHQLLAIRQTVGMVFQNPDNQLVATMVEEDVAFALENLGMPSADIRLRVDEVLRQVGMYEYREHAPHRLSGGQKQRVAIAGVIAMCPRFIVLDEPTAMLDPLGRHEVMQTVRTLCREQGIGVVLITHHMSEAVQCDRVIVMDKGRLYMDGSPRDIFSQTKRLASVGLAAPQSVSLLDELRAHGFDIPLGAMGIDECAESIFRALARKPHQS